MTAHELLLGGDPDGDGSWELATPWLAVTLPPLLIQLKQWDVLCARVWGSLPFVAFAVLEHGPDVVLAQMDATRAGMEAEEQEVRLLADNPAHHPDDASPWAWVGASGPQDKKQSTVPRPLLTPFPRVALPCRAFGVRAPQCCPNGLKSGSVRSCGICGAC